MDDDVKIIKHGRFYNKVVRFVCFNCGCVFETSDATFAALCGRVTYQCRCPECHERNVITKDADEVAEAETADCGSREQKSTEPSPCGHLVRPGICDAFISVCCPYQSVDYNGEDTHKFGECLCTYPRVSMPEPYYTAFKKIHGAINGEGHDGRTETHD